MTGLYPGWRSPSQARAELVQRRPASAVDHSEQAFRLEATMSSGALSDVDRPSVARVYDYLLGGWHNFGADREWAERAIAVLPDIPRIARANRHFLCRAVRFCLDTGVRQFLDVGCGLPRVGSVHEIAQRADPTARVAYVDVDPVVVALANSILAGNERACVIQEDVRRPEAVLGAVEATRVLDLERPIAVLLVAVLHFVGDADDPVGVVERLLAPLASGSHLVISHATDCRVSVWEPVNRLCGQTAVVVTARSRVEVERLFGGCELVDPGVVWLPRWRPEFDRDADADARWSSGLAGVGRKL
jgi:SAM-dependent methyltransferase